MIGPAEISLHKNMLFFCFCFYSEACDKGKFCIGNPEKDLLIYLFYACACLYNMTVDLPFLTTLSIGYPRSLDFSKFS